MTATFEFDRELLAALDAEGPTQPPAGLVEEALTQARAIRQRRPAVAILDRRAWPARRVSIANPALARPAMLALVAVLLLALVGGLLAFGGSLLQRLAAPAGWTLAAPMAQARDDSATVTLLADGRVLAAGGGPSGARFRSAEVYNPALDTWTTVPDMAAGRGYAAATRLQDGRVLVSGGNGGRQSELFDPATGTWSPAGEMVEVRSQHVAVLLPNGLVLAAGGTAGSDPSLVAELFDPVTNGWRPTGAMLTWRASPTATLLPNGTVLVVQGFGQGIDLRAAEIYDPATETWSATGFASEFRSDDQTATLLLDGTVLVFGGAANVAEVYDPSSGLFSTIAAPLAPQRFGSAALLADGKVLLAGGGLEEPAPLTFAELYDPVTRSWAPTAPLHVARMGAKAVALIDGSVLLVGGVDSSGPLASVERYTP